MSMDATNPICFASDIGAHIIFIPQRNPVKLEQKCN